MGYFSTLIRGQDLFGHPVQLNFARSGPRHNTVLGGLVSLLVKAFIVFYFGLLLKKMVNNEGDKVSTQTYADNDGFETPAEDLELASFLTISNFEDQFSLKDLKPYVSIEVFYEDWSSAAASDRHELSMAYSVSDCVEQDFARSSQTKATFETLKRSFKPLCLPNIPGARIKGDSSSLDGATYSVYFKPCSGQGCASNDAISKFLDTLSITGWAVPDSIDFKHQSDGKPVFQALKKVFSVKANRHAFEVQNIHVRRNKIEFYDSLINLGLPSYEGSFFSISHVVREEQQKGLRGTAFFGFAFRLDNLYDLHDRRSYNLLDLIGDLGGVLEVVTLVLGAFILPISSHSFSLAAIEKLFVVKSSEKLFKLSERPKKLQNPQGIDTNSKFQEAIKHHKIAFSLCDSLKLFCIKTACFCCSVRGACARLCLSRKTNLQRRLIQTGQDRLDSDFRIEKVVKHVRNQRALYKLTQQTPSRDFDIQIHPKNVISLDSDHEGNQISATKLENHLSDSEVAEFEPPFPLREQAAIELQKQNRSEEVSNSIQSSSAFEPEPSRTSSQEHKQTAAQVERRLSRMGKSSFGRRASLMW